jgi:hypothetical protein
MSGVKSYFAANKQMYALYMTFVGFGRWRYVGEIFGKNGKSSHRTFGKFQLKMSKVTFVFVCFVAINGSEKTAYIFLKIINFMNTHF